MSTPVARRGADDAGSSAGSFGGGARRDYARGARPGEPDVRAVRGAGRELRAEDSLGIRADARYGRRDRDEERPRARDRRGGTGASQDGARGAKRGGTPRADVGRGKPAAGGRGGAPRYRGEDEIAPIRPKRGGSAPGGAARGGAARGRSTPGGSARGGPRPARRERGTVVADRRGLTAAGVVIVELVPALLGAGFDVATRDSLGPGFAVGFVVGAFFAAIAAHREDLLAVVVAAPLVFVAVTVAGNVVDPSTASSSFITSQLLDLAVALVTRAPTLFAGFGVAAFVALVRALGSRSSRPPPAPRHHGPGKNRASAYRPTH